MELFQVYSTSDVLDGQRNVRIRWVMDADGRRQLFGSGGSLDIPYSQVIEDYENAPRDHFVCPCGEFPCTCPDLDPDLPYVPAELAVEELFTRREAEAVAEFLRRYTDYDGIEITQVKLPIPNTWRCFAVLPDPHFDYIMLIPDPMNTNLSFGIGGYAGERVTQLVARMRRRSVDIAIDKFAAKAKMGWARKTRRKRKATGAESALPLLSHHHRR